MSNKISRRQFLYMGGLATASLALRDFLGVAETFAQDDDSIGLLAYQHERQKIASLSDLTVNEPVMFRYPYDHATAENQLIKMGVPAGGGIGSEQDIVAFHSTCPHQGGPLANTYKANHQALGPCPFHLSTFDLTRHGMVIAGHASQGLSQIVLELDGDDIYAVGVMGLLYGYYDNAVDPSSLGV